MAEIINTNVFVPTAEGAQKFVDFKGLDYFWSKAKAYVDASDKETADKVAALEEVVGNDNSGLVKDVKSIQDELNSLSGGAGSIATQIDNAIATLDVEDTAVEGQYVSSVKEVDGKIEVTRANLPVYEEVGVAAGLNEAMDTRVKVLEAIDHEKLASDASAAAVATILDNAPESFDTLKEVADWIANNDHADDVATLMTDVENLKKIDHEAYKAADETVLTNAKTYADGLVMTDGVAKFDAAGAAATAKSEAIAQAKLDAAEALKSYYTKEETDGLVDAINGNIESAAATAKEEAIADADAKLANKANSADVYTKTEVDGLLQTNSTADQAYAKTYTDALFTSMTFATNDDIDGLFPQA